MHVVDGEACRRIEEALARAPLVGEVAAVFHAVDVRPWAVVWPDPTAISRGLFANLHEALRFRLESAACRLPVVWRPRGVTIARGRLPRLGDGDVDRATLVEQLGASPARSLPQRPSDNTPLPGGWSELLRRFRGLGAPEGTLVRETSLEFDLGLDSLDRLALILGLGELLGVPVPQEAPNVLLTLGDVVDFLGADRATRAPGATALDLDARRVLRASRGSDTVIGARWLRPSRFTWPLVAASRVIVHTTARAKLDFSVVGRDRVDWSQRPLMVAQNHQSHLDPLLLARALPARAHRHVTFLGFIDYFGQGLGRLPAAIYKIQPISADRGVVQGLRVAVAAVEAGRVLTIYPEGERSWDGTLVPFKRGVAWIARETRAHVVPSAIVGAYQAWPRGWKFRPHAVRIAFGAPLAPPEHDSGRPGEVEFLGRLRAAIAGLMRELGADPDLGDPYTWEHGTSV